MSTIFPFVEWKDVCFHSWENILACFRVASLHMASFARVFYLSRIGKDDNKSFSSLVELGGSPCFV